MKEYHFTIDGYLIAYATSKKKAYEELKVIIDEIYEDIDEHDFSVIEHQTTELSDLEEDAGHGPVVKLVNFLIYSAVQEGASDIHIEPGRVEVTVRIRIDGVLIKIMSPPMTSLNGMVARIKILSKLNIAEHRVPQDGRMKIKTSNHFCKERKIYWIKWKNHMRLFLH